MTTIIKMEPEVEADLTRQAVRAGATAKTLTEGQLDRTLQELAQFTNKIPALPDEAFLRETFYRQHDEDQP